MPTGLSAVQLHNDHVFGDLDEGNFTDDDQAGFLDDVDELRDHLLQWDRNLTKCLTILNTSGPETVYRRRCGDIRSYWIRDGDTLWCIGVGKRKTTYDRDLNTIIDRADAILDT